MAIHEKSPDQRTLIKNALLKIDELHAKLKAYEAEKSEPIAIVGMGCRFPGGANSPEAFWQLLENGQNAIREVPPNRWDINAYFDPDPDTPGKMSTRYGGFIDHVDEFDAPFFGIAPREAASMTRNSGSYSKWPGKLWNRPISQLIVCMGVPPASSLVLSARTTPNGC